jgi:hypothetical protein
VEATENVFLLAFSLLTFPTLHINSSFQIFSKFSQCGGMNGTFSGDFGAMIEKKKKRRK